MSPMDLRPHFRSLLPESGQTFREVSERANDRIGRKAPSAQSEPSFNCLAKVGEKRDRADIAAPVHLDATGRRSGSAAQNSLAKWAISSISAFSSNTRRRHGRPVPPGLGIPRGRRACRTGAARDGRRRGGSGRTDCVRPCASFAHRAGVAPDVARPDQHPMPFGCWSAEARPAARRAAPRAA